MSSDVRVSALLTRSLCEFFQTIGLDSMSLCSRADVDLRSVEEQGWLSLADFDRLLLRAVAMSGDPSLGLHWAERSPMFQLDLPMSLIVAAPKLRDVMRALVQIQLLFANREQCAFTESGSRSVIALNVLAASDEGLRVLTELALGGLLRTFRYRGDDGLIRRINVGYAPPPNASEYKRIFGPRLRFDQRRTSIEFTSVGLDREHPLGNEERFQRIGEQAAELRQRVLAGMSIAEQLEGQMRAALPRVATMADAATALGMSERSLRRRLAEESIRYGALIDSVQRTRAQELLAIGDKSVKEVAHALGFANASSFIRAYRRWTGRAPGADRSSLLKRVRGSR